MSHSFISYPSKFFFSMNLGVMADQIVRFEIWANCIFAQIAGQSCRFYKKSLGIVKILQPKFIIKKDGLQCASVSAGEIVAQKKPNEITSVSFGAAVDAEILDAADFLRAETAAQSVLLDCGYEVARYQS